MFNQYATSFEVKGGRKFIDFPRCVTGSATKYSFQDPEPVVARLGISIQAFIEF
jgi:hypothetical protein